MTELEHKAAEAWQAMSLQPNRVLALAAGVQPMPPGVALDMVQDVCGDRDDAVAAILDAAARWLWDAMPNPDMTGAKADVPSITGHIRGEGFGHATLLVEAIRERARSVRLGWTFSTRRVPTNEYTAALEWHTWCTLADLAIRLGRELVAAAHPAAA